MSYHELIFQIDLCVLTGTEPSTELKLEGWYIGVDVEQIYKERSHNG